MATTELPACFAVVPIPRLDTITFMIFVVILGFALVLLRTLFLRSCGPRKGSHQDTPNKPLQQASKGLLGRAVASVQTCLRNYILRTVTPKLVSELLAVYAENARLKADINRLQQEVRGSVPADTHIRVRK
ncbi:hypothetical protein WJX82_003301 [Trebouxia sp. C0006]